MGAILPFVKWATLVITTVVTRLYLVHTSKVVRPVVPLVRTPKATTARYGEGLHPIYRVDRMRVTKHLVVAVGKRVREEVKVKSQRLDNQLVLVTQNE